MAARTHRGAARRTGLLERVGRHPRFMADTTGDGRADVVGFGDAGVWVSRF
jgi:hypothetical protein